MRTSEMEAGPVSRTNEPGPETEPTAGEGGPTGSAGRGLDATLAAVATLTAAWPISTLLADPTWLRGTALLLAVIVLVGIGARSLALRSWQILMVQLVCSVLAASQIYGRDHLWHGLPSLETVRFAGELIREAVATAQKYAAPAPSSPGLIFVVGCSLGLVALVVDYLAVTRRCPAWAGPPLLAVFLAAVANQGSTLPVIFFLAAAAGWLVLMARAGSSNLRRWSTTGTRAITPVPHTLAFPAASGLREHASMARALGSMALVVAVAAPVVLPELPPRFLASGLGRSSSENTNNSQTVGFSQSLNLGADLQDPTRTPVLQYTTTDPAPPPLGVALGSQYRSEAGLWVPWGRPWAAGAASDGLGPAGPGSDGPGSDGLGSDGRPDGNDLSTRPTIPEPAGLSPGVPRKGFAVNVRGNRLEAPHLAAPYPMTGADLSGVAWGADDQTQRIRVAERPDSYRVSYLHLSPSAALLRGSPSLSGSDLDAFDIDMALEGPYVKNVTALTKRLTAGKRSAYDKAMAIQEYLRTDGGFTYSLTLAPPVKNQSGTSAGLDPLTNFLVTKQGYCVQFATAMVMMSRAAGIPARMAIGFLPGTQSKGVWTVVAADAHTWPQLYLEGVGWTRFEPTPARATPPSYAVDATSAAAQAEGGPTGTATAPALGSTPPKDLGDRNSDGASPDVGVSSGTVLGWLTQGWGAALLLSLIGLLGLMLVPSAARWRRWRSLNRARNDAERIEVQWELLTSSMADLGIARATSRTPRQAGAYYDREALLDGAASQALGRVVQTLERSRYATSPPRRDSVSEDARHVLRTLAGTRSGRLRLRAALWPELGILQLRSASAFLARAIRRLEDTLRRWSGWDRVTRRSRWSRPSTLPQRMRAAAGRRPGAKGLRSKD